MASKIIVDQIEKTGGSLTALTLPTGNASAGQVLQNDGSGNLSWAADAAGGVTHASQWRLTADFTGDAVPIASNLEAVIAAVPTTSTASPTSSTALGAPMTVSSGIFTFPATGYWSVQYDAYMQADSAGSSSNEMQLQATTNNSTYLLVAETNIIINSTGFKTNGVTNFIFDVTDTTQCKCRFEIHLAVSDVITKGNATKNETFFTFIRFADT